MTSSWSWSERRATAEEIARLRSRAGLYASFGCILLLAMPLIGGIVTLARAERWPLLMVIGTAIAALPVAGVLFGFLGHVRRGRRRERADARQGIVQVIAVDGAPAWSIPGLHSSVEPAFAFELGPVETLLLIGQWLGDAPTYGGNRADPSGLPPPYTFPTAAFTVHRFPRSGCVCRIELRGPPVPAPPVAAPVDLTVVNEYMSLVLQCPLSGLAAAMEARVDDALAGRMVRQWRPPRRRPGAALR